MINIINTKGVLAYLVANEFWTTGIEMTRTGRNTDRRDIDLPSVLNTTLPLSPRVSLPVAI
jgi:hypothetical protein